MFRNILSLLIFSLAVQAGAPLDFPDACAQGNRIIIAAVGDILLHHPLQARAKKEGFGVLWEEALPYLKGADIVYGNLEGPIGVGLNSRVREVADPLEWDFSVYSTYPLFNYHPSLAPALKASGFTIVSNANNHALDRGSLGMDKTIGVLDEAGILHTGAAVAGHKLPPLQIVESKGFKIGWIACTEHTNGNADKHQQISHCYEPNNYSRILETIRTNRHSLDAIIVSPHWGDEYKPKPNKRQIAFAHEVLEAGATAIIGAHPHVLEPVESFTTKDGRTTLIAYSLGNFVSHQGSTATRSTVILLVGLTKKNSETVINGIRYVPMYMENKGGSPIHLRPMGATDKAALNIVSQAIDDEHAVYSLPIVTNPGCPN